MTTQPRKRISPLDYVVKAYVIDDAESETLYIIGKTGTVYKHGPDVKRDSMPPLSCEWEPVDELPEEAEYIGHYFYAQII